MTSFRHLRPQVRDQDAAHAFFLRHIPAKCDAEILRNFLESKGLADFEMEMPLFPKGKSRGFAVIRFGDGFAAQQKSTDNIHGQFVPGFKKATPLCLEPLRGGGPWRCMHSPSFVPAGTPQPLPPGTRRPEFHSRNMPGKEGTFKAPRVHAEASSGFTTSGTRVPKSEPAREMAPHEATIKGTQACSVPACTIVLSAEGKLSWFL
mmetsp:Transcript_17031/g.40120  ORF Transcript_17031/g.40120 Transcript_17031/m.40120 type:complete len:205 (-) Transcript_17031:69-683(-)